MVLSLVSNGTQSPGSAAIRTGSSSQSPNQNTEDLVLDEDDTNLENEESDTEQVTKSFGIMKVDTKSQKSYYVSEAHWTSILHDIAEVKNFFTTNKKQVEEQMEKVQATGKGQEVFGSPLLFGSVKPPSESEILSSFPSKYTADLLIDRYFNTDPFIRIIHEPTFRKEYERHWINPSKSSIVWIGMVFGMMRLAMLSFQEGDEPVEFAGKCWDIAESYQKSLAHCLCLADYTKPHRYVIEALVLHLQGEFSQNAETQISIWILVGMIVRLAMRMGYHRDAKMFPNISAFQGEMRRRVWAFVRSADILLSFQVGLPSMVRSSDSDTEFPRKLYEEDFGEDSPELPPERPLNESTPTSYLIAKIRLTYVFQKVLEHSQKVKGSSYEEVMEIDRELRQARDLIPDLLRVKPRSEWGEDPAYLLMSRFDIIIVYHKAQCVLHRPFLHRARENPRYIYSRRACIDSSLELLKIQFVTHDGSRPGGPLHNRKWYTNRLNSHDFLLASTILAVDLNYEYQSNNSGTDMSNLNGWGINRQEEMLTAIRRSRDLWDEVKDESMDAWKAVSILGLFLEKLNKGSQNYQSPSTDGTFDAQDEKQSAAMTLGLLSSGVTPLSPAGLSQLDGSTTKVDQNFYHGTIDAMQQSPAPQTPFGMFGQMPDMQPSTLDWETWDKYLQVAGPDYSGQGFPWYDNQQMLSQSALPTSPPEFPQSSIGRGGYPAEQSVAGNGNGHLVSGMFLGNNPANIRDDRFDPNRI